MKKSIFKLFSLISLIVVCILSFCCCSSKEELKEKLLCDWQISDKDSNGNANTIKLDFSENKVKVCFTCPYLNLYDDVWDECEYEIIDSNTFKAKKNGKWEEFNVTFSSNNKMIVEPAFTSNKSKETLTKVH